MKVSLQTTENSMYRAARPSVNFKRAWSEHVSWGANYIKETGKTNFKLYSFPDAKAVFVEIADKAVVGLDNIKNRVVQTVAALTGGLAIKTILPKDDKSKIYEMKNSGDGIFEAEGIDAKPDDKYRYVIATADNNINIVKDPYSKKQENINGWSSIYNKDSYHWVNTDWIEGKDARRIVRKPYEEYRGLAGLLIDEINIPTLSQEGTFDAAKGKIDEIAELGLATAIELLPLENTYSLQWGYDGVDKFAVNEKMGGADKLKELIDYAHGKGLNVIIDMVPNHMGTDGDYLTQTGPYEKGSGMFGGEFNYERPNNRYVRDWMANAALMWAKEFNADGLRLDMTKLCGSDYLLRQIVTELNEHAPNVFLIAEDGRDNKESVTRYENNYVNHEDSLKFIDTQVDFITNLGWHSTPVNIGFDSEWDFKFMHTMKNALINSSPSLLDDLDDRIKQSGHRVKYVMSHDEIGNEDGTRLIPKILSSQLFIFGKVDGKNDAEKGQKAAHAAQKLAELVVSEDFWDMSYSEFEKYQRAAGLNTTIPKMDLLNAFKTAFAKHKLGMGTVMTVPGPKMFFQGDEKADLSYFKFFREFSDEKEKRAKSDDYKNSIIEQKGYDTLEKIARPDCIVGRLQPKGIFSNLSKQMESFYIDLKNIYENNDVLKKGHIMATYKDMCHNVHIHHLGYDGKNELLIIKNFGHGFHMKNYGYEGFPNGDWKEIFNSDAIEYGGSGFINDMHPFIFRNNQNLYLAPNSFLILQKIVP